MIAILVQMRLKSKRLPLKALRKINSVPIIQLFPQRFAYTGLETIICTSNDPQDDLIEEYAISRVYRGDPDNVAKRFLDCAKHYNLDRIVRVTGDNPLTCPIAIKEMAKTEGDYIYTETLPRGTRPEVISLNVLEEMAKANPGELEFTPWLKENVENKKKLELHPIAPDIKLTIDTYQDLQKVRSIYQRFSLPDFEKPEIRKIVEWVQTTT